jgi:vacuolar-type H+-ATPase subunit C/Vma6
MTPYLAPALLLVFVRCHDSAGRQSVATSIDGKLKQKEAGRLYEFINVLIQPLNEYLTTELHRKVPLSAARLARFALDKQRETKQIEAKASAKKAALAMMRQPAKRPS